MLHQNVCLSGFSSFLISSIISPSNYLPPYPPLSHYPPQNHSCYALIITKALLLENVVKTLWEDLCATRRKLDDLADSEGLWLDAWVRSLDLSDGSLGLAGQVEEGVSGNNGVVVNRLARASRADGNVDDLSDGDDVWVADLRVGRDESVSSDFEVLCNGTKSVTADDGVGWWRTLDASVGGGRVWGGDTRGVVGGGAANGDGEDLVGEDEVDVVNAAGGSNVADTDTSLVRDLEQGVTGLHGVLAAAGGAARKGVACLRVSGADNRSAWSLGGFVAVLTPNYGSLGDSADEGGSGEDVGLHCCGCGVAG